MNLDELIEKATDLRKLHGGGLIIHYPEYDGKEVEQYTISINLRIEAFLRPTKNGDVVTEKLVILE